jgi:hypothetical protein
MNQISTQVIAAVPVCSARASASLLAERVRERAHSLGCKGLWARAAGRHVILGMGEQEAFARVTPLGASAYGLAFRGSPLHASAEATAGPRSASRWAPLLLIDGLAAVVEHALIGEGSVHRLLSCM